MNIKPEYLKAEFSNPFNYTGSKHRYLAELFEVLPGTDNLKVLDPFLGGGDLISKLPASWNITASDISPQLILMHKEMQSGFINTESALKFNEFHCLDKVNEFGYERLKFEYNESLVSPEFNSMALYSLICHSNSNRMRFNNDGGFNVPFGKRFFNENMQRKLDNYSKWIKCATVDFKRQSFEEFDFRDFDLLLIDSPYPNSVACYNERKGWTFNQELKLYIKIDSADCHGVKFVYFGQTWANGTHNPTLEKWANQYNVKILKDTSHQCSSNRKNEKTVEIMVSN